jgi:hypothetical protein
VRYLDFLWALGIERWYRSVGEGDRISKQYWRKRKVQE